MHKDLINNPNKRIPVIGSITDDREFFLSAAKQFQ